MANGMARRRILSSDHLAVLAISLWSEIGMGQAKPKIGVFRPSTGEWFFDINGNGSFDGCQS